MDDRATLLTQLGARLAVSWSDVEIERALARLHARRLRRRRAAIGFVVGVAAAGIALFAAHLAASRGSRQAWSATAPRQPIVATAPRQSVATTAPRVASVAPPIALGDGSMVTPLDPSTRVETGEISPSMVTIRLLAGGARFHVVHQPARVFRVISGDVSLIDLGTDFTVVRDADVSVVEVIAGNIRVEWGDGVAEMIAGERRRFPPVEVHDTVAAPSVEHAAGPRPPPRIASPPRPAIPATQPDIEDLLRTADQARLHGDPAAAIVPLRRIIAEHAGDPRAPLAAFTLGRVLLEELNNPTAAAAAFAHARALAPSGPLAEDALAREVEAWARAGDPGHARARAKEYLDDYPEGSRVREVKQRANLP